MVLHKLLAQCEGITRRVSECLRLKSIVLLASPFENGGLRGWGAMKI